MERKWIHVFRSIFHWLFFLVLVFGFCNDGNKSRGKHLLAKQNDALVREIMLSKHQFCVSAEILQYIPPILNTYFFIFFAVVSILGGKKHVILKETLSCIHSVDISNNPCKAILPAHTQTHISLRADVHMQLRGKANMRVCERRT